MHVGDHHCAPSMICVFSRDLQVQAENPHCQGQQQQLMQVNRLLLQK